MTVPKATIEKFQRTPSDPRHGTINGYHNLMCSCDRCRKAWRLYHLAYMYGHPEQVKRHNEWTRKRDAAR